MAKFISHLKDNYSDKVLGEYKTKKEAIASCLNSVRASHCSEERQASIALEDRGFYCMGWSDREVYIIEE